jgi:sulfur carrier protein
VSESSASIHLTVNGQPHSSKEGDTVSDLLAALGLKRDGVAVAVNGRVVPRSTHAVVRLESGQQVEVVQAVGGG